MSHACDGTGSGHCCWLGGSVCDYLEENTVPGRRWACGLLRELGSWDLVYADPRYEAVRQALDRNPSLVGVVCGDWPRPGETCGECGAVGAAD